MQKLTPYLWFDKDAKEASELYTSLLPGSRIKDATTIHDTPSGSVDILTVELAGLGFTLMSAGPLFRFTPAVSFLVACDTKQEVDKLWGELSKGGSALMELGQYPFSKRYGWVQDRYGLSWQVMLAEGGDVQQRVIPTLLFAGSACGKAEKAINFYASVFRDAKIGEILRYVNGEEPDTKGTIKHAAFTLENVEFAAMDSARVHDVAFNEAISFMVNCGSQEEIDYYWDKLSAVPEAEQCGWLKDRYGLSWQIVPRVLGEMIKDRDKARVARVTAAFLKMKKFDIAKLKEAYEGG